jgi:hypothetical protein
VELIFIAIIEFVFMYIGSFIKLLIKGNFNKLNKTEVTKVVAETPNTCFLLGLAFWVVVILIIKFL